MTYALIDGNCFYCSCERVFMPALKGQPLVVLSNNDGCAIARTDEAKALGIKMGVPWFQIRHFAESHGLMALSANFALYGDMSDRMMTVIGRFSPVQEVYSIDESFLDLTGIRDDLTLYGQRIRQEVLRDTGIPTCVGMGPTKTLAKLANHIAKKQAGWDGVCDLSALSRHELARRMSEIEVREVWGVGRQISKRLNEMGIYTVLDLAKLDPERARYEFSIVLGKTVQELRGMPRIELDEVTEPKKQIISSRSFGLPVTALPQLENALSEFIAIACNKLRRQDSVASTMQIFIRTSPFRKEKQYGNCRTVNVPVASSDSLAFTKVALRALQQIFRPGYNYAKAGVMLMDIEPAEAIQQELFPNDEEVDRRADLMTTLDAINARFGRGSLKTGSIGFHEKDNWYMRQERKTQGYTTNWNEVLTVRA